MDKYLTQPLHIQALAWFGVAELVLIAVMGWVFVARHARTDWWEFPEGRYLMRSKVGMSLLYTMTLVFLVVNPKILTRLVVTVLIFGFIAYTLADLLVLQTKAKRERKAEAAAARLAQSEE